MRTATLFSILMFVACEPQVILLTSGKDAAMSNGAGATGTGGARADAGTIMMTASSTTASLTAAVTVTRHLPGTAITTATGKYTYLVQSNGNIAPFASVAIATASGYGAPMIVTVSATELYCYGRGDQITAALPAPAAGRLRDGTLVKEKGKTDTYVVSDGVAWPIINGNVFTEAGYDWDNVIEIAAGSLASKVDAVGNCVIGVACLDEAYLTSCAQDTAIVPLPTSTAISTMTATSVATSAPPSATATSVATATLPVVSPPANAAAATVTRHLPGTAITTATGKYTYLVQSDGTAAPFASAAIVTASGYTAAMVITVSATELYCYGRGDQITAALPAPAAGQLRDGTLAKEKGKTDTYAVSGGVAWPIKNGTVFTEAGYDWDNVVEIPAGTLASKVDAVGDCVAGLFCLDEAYLMSCGQDETIAPLPTSTATSVATSIATSTPVATAVELSSSATSAATSSPTVSTVATQSAAVTATATTVTATATKATIATQTAIVTATASSVVTVATVTTVTSVSTATATNNQPPSTIDLSWVYASAGTELCLNAAYFAGDDEAVLLIWSGPGADAVKGPVALQTDGRFCWDFASKGKGLYYFWADVPDPSCSSDICSRDAVNDNGAMYMTAPKATAAARKWLHCEPTGCDGAAYWDGSSFTPMGD